MTELKRCPLCGTKASVERLDALRSSPTYNVACGVLKSGQDTCGLVLFGGKDTRKAMVEKWNNRTTPPTGEEES